MGASYNMGMKLKQKLSAKFNQIHLRKNEKKYFNILDQLLDVIFAKGGELDKNLRGLLHKDKDAKEVIAKYLPFHTNDTPWLVQYVEKALTNYLSKQNANGTDLDTEKAICKRMDIARKYVATSQKFNGKRQAYQQNLIKAYIGLAQDTRNGDFCACPNTKASERYDNNYDVLFRDRVVKAMGVLNLNQDVVEASLEINADLWRPQTRAISFANTYNFSGLLTNENERKIMNDVHPVEWREFEKKENMLKKTWTDLRDYEYFKAHGNAVKKYGKVNHAMKMSSYTTVMKNIELAHMNEWYKVALPELHANNRDLFENKTVIAPHTPDAGIER